MYKRLLFCSQCYFPINKGQCVGYMIHLALFPAFLAPHTESWGVQPGNVY